MRGSLPWLSPTSADVAAGYLLPLLDPFQVALLAGGAERATDTAIVSLADCGLLRAEVISAQFGGRFFAGGTPAAGAHPIELTVHATAARPNAPWFFESIHDWNVRLLQARDQAGKLKERQRMRAHHEGGRARDAAGAGRIPRQPLPCGAAACRGRAARAPATGPGPPELADDQAHASRPGCAGRTASLSSSTQGRRRRLPIMFSRVRPGSARVSHRSRSASSARPAARSPAGTSVTDPDSASYNAFASGADPSTT